MKKSILGKFISASVPVLKVLMPLNFLGGTISIIWLIVLGEWDVVITGIIQLLFGPFSIGLVLGALLLLVMGPAGKFDEMGWDGLSKCFLALGGLITYGIIIGWVCSTLFYFDAHIRGDNFIPIALLIYKVSVNPWIYMAQKEAQGPDGTFEASVTAFFVQISVISVLFSYYLFDFQMKELIIIQIIIYSIQLLIVFSHHLTEKRRERRDLESMFSDG